ncbi:MAG: thioredoxin family protein [Tissierellia bacterium]|nr:thioredoxin family protein [Tissierellia bacterium]
MLFRKKEENNENKNTRIKVLGSGCSKCNELEKNTKEVLKDLNIDEEVAHIKDFKEIMKYGVMTTPVLLVDEKILVSGRVPNIKELKELIQENI